MSSGVVYVPDDEETIEDEAQLPADDSELIWRSKPGAIELQVLGASGCRALGEL